MTVGAAAACGAAALDARQQAAALAAAGSFPAEAAPADGGEGVRTSYAFAALEAFSLHERKMAPIQGDATLALQLSQHNCPLIALSPIRTRQRGFAIGRAL